MPVARDHKHLARRLPSHGFVEEAREAVLVGVQGVGARGEEGDRHRRVKQDPLRIGRNEVEDVAAVTVKPSDRVDYRRRRGLLCEGAKLTARDTMAM